MSNYIWEQVDWPNFVWDEKALLPKVSSARLKQGKLIQKVQSLVELEFRRAEALIFEEETLKTAQIEGEKYNPQSVRSSIHRRLGLDYSGLPQTERHIDGLVEVLFDATLNSDKALTIDRLCSWQAALFPTGYSGMSKIDVGKLRTDKTGPMQVVSGPIDREKVHFEAPMADVVGKEISNFVRWWNNSQSEIDGVLRAGIAHLYFVTIHPFDDGNGRLARALADMALAQDDKLAKRYYSLSGQVLKNKNDYYRILEETQKGDLEITNWLVWFVECFEASLDTSEMILQTIFSKSKFWSKFQLIEINQRQRKVVNVLLDAGKGNFEGGLTTRKYVGMNRVSRATAVREINDLLSKGVLRQNDGSGRNVSYDLSW